jgi:hypothetical protein
MKLQTDVTFRCPRFKPTPGEIDENHEDFINPGVFAKQAASFLAKELAGKGYTVRGIVSEDWGCWVQVDNPDKYFLAVGIANYDDDRFRAFETETHRLFIEPDKSPVRRWLKKIDTEERVMLLLSHVLQILEADDGITDIQVGDL